MTEPETSGDVTTEPAEKRRLTQRWGQRVELISVILLSLASLGAAWCGYQASAWGGEQSALYSQAGARRTDATHTRTLAYLRGVGDTGMFTSWVDAYAVGDQPLMDFYRARFSPPLEAAMQAWLALDPLNNPDAPRLPINMPEYRIEELEQADALEAEAATLFARGQEASERNSAYVLNTVIFATVLFFAGLSTKVNWLRARLLTVGLSSVMFLLGVIRLLTLPLT